jgi:predicted DNA-binding protein (MmcQ/YjbR family)
MAANAEKTYSATLYEHCKAKPDAVEDHPWGETVFKIRGRVFAFLGRGDSSGVTVKAPPEDIDLLLAQPSITKARYVGRYGWVSVKIENDEMLKLALGLIDDSYDLISKPRRRS